MVLIQSSGQSSGQLKNASFGEKLPELCTRHFEKTLKSLYGVSVGNKTR